MQQPHDQRTWWLLAGVAIGVGLSYLWPMEHVQASATDREERFAITTTATGYAQAESVFVLDFLTGRLAGATLSNQTTKFTQFYFRMITADFGLDANTKPKFVVIPGQAELQGSRGVTPAFGVIYVGELNSGRVIAYGYSTKANIKQIQPPQPLIMMDAFTFREATTE